MHWALGKMTLTTKGILDDNYFTCPSEDEDLSFPILIVGGSTAAYSATLAALKAGANVCLVQPQKVLGGQFTTQALPASDDGKLLQKKPSNLIDSEKFAISKTQKAFRDRARQLQKVNGKAIDNPGGGWVSPFAVTPVNAAQALNQGIIPYLTNGQLTLIAFAEPIEVLITESAGQLRRVTGVVFQDRQTNHRFTVNANIVMEATDLGDLLELGQIESRVGQESRHQTGESALPETPYPMCQQAITVCAVVEKSASGEGVPIGAPDGYDQVPWLNAQDFTSIFWIRKSSTWEKRYFYHNWGIFRYRRLQRSQQTNTPKPGDVTVINWATSPRGDNGNPPPNNTGEPLCCGNDYRMGALVGVSIQDRQKHIQQARDRARAYIHYLQTNGISDLKPRGDLTWTDDGIALEPYIREARRGVALTTIRHEDVAQKFFGKAARARCFDDSVGIGQYHYLDVHPNDTPGHVDLGNANISLPFTIPLTALIPINTNGLILSAKSIGTTHITNSAYRMHPVEWAIGEAGGYLAAFALNQGVEVRQVATEVKLKRQFQGWLAQQGIPLFWFDDVGHDDPDFEAIQVLAVAGIVRTEDHTNLHFNPEGQVNRAVVCIAIVNVMGFDLVNSSVPSFQDVPREHFAYQSIETLAAKGIVSGVGNRRFAPTQPCTREQLSFILGNLGGWEINQLFAGTPIDATTLKRRELSRILYRLLHLKQ